MTGYFKTPTGMGVLVCGLLILVGPLYTAPGYSLIAHTSSDLGAQNTPFNWLMNIGFFALGAGVALDARRRWWDAPFISILFLAFGVAMALTGVFSLRPIDPALPFDDWADLMHSIMATVVGFCFVGGATAYMFFTPDRQAKAASFLAALLATGFSLAMAFLPGYEGLLQRLMFLVTFTWLVVYLPAPRGR